jgi:hypothetical protein
MITANELKINGVGALSNALKDEPETIISVRGKPSYIVMSIETYNRYREYELEAALTESQSDISNGKFYESSVDEHIKRITNAV